MTHACYPEWSTPPNSKCSLHIECMGMLHSFPESRGFRSPLSFPRSHHYTAISIAAMQIRRRSARIFASPHGNLRWFCGDAAFFFTHSTTRLSTQFRSDCIYICNSMVHTYAAFDSVIHETGTDQNRGRNILTITIFFKIHQSSG